MDYTLVKPQIIAIDFDSTMVKYKYPEVGEPIEDAIETVERLIEAGHRIILYTMRSGERLVQAVEYMEENEIELWGVNENPSQHHWNKPMSPKIFANLYIDDCSLGIPLEFEETGRPFVDWVAVADLLEQQGFLDG